MREALTMTLKFQLDTLDGLDESVAALYTESEDGTFTLGVEGLPEPKADNSDTEAMKKALERERINAEKARKAAGHWKSLGVEPDEVEQLLKEREEQKNKRLKDAGEFEKLLNQHKEKWEAEKNALQTERDSAVKALKSHVGESAFVTELAKAGATEEGVSLLPLSFVRRIRVDIVDDKPSVEVLAPDGETPMAGTSKDGRATLHDLVEEATKTFPSLFKGKGISGGGKPPQNGSGGKPGRTFEEMSGADLKALREAKPEEYERLKNEYKERTS